MGTDNALRKVAVVGMGRWGENLVRNYHELNALHSVCDIDPDVKPRWQSTYPSVKIVAELDAILRDPTVDAVAIATPAPTHHCLAKAALEAGKDVFIEKPLAMDVNHGKELVELAVSGGRILMVGHVLQYHPAVVKLHELTQQGELGIIQYLYSNRLNIGRIRSEENILWSFAPHDISVILSLVNEHPTQVTCQGSDILSRGLPDVTLSQLVFPNGVQAHIFVSWLHPFKEQRLVVVGSRKMAVFDDTAENKLTLYPHKVEWTGRIPTAIKAEAQFVAVEPVEPLRAECQHFLDCLMSRKAPRTDGLEGLRVLAVLEECQRSLSPGRSTPRFDAPGKPARPPYFAHESAFVDDGASVGKNTKIWHFSHILPGARIGERCIIGQNVNVAGGTVIGNNVKIQNNVSVYGGTIIEDDVFLGPACVLTNVTNPRAQVDRHAVYETTTLKRGCTIGANATVVCGTTIGRYAFVAAGSVVTTNVPDYALVMGNPARKVAWMSRHGHRLGSPDENGVMRCPESNYRYKLSGEGILHCIDLDEAAPLPKALSKGSKSYRQFRQE